MTRDMELIRRILLRIEQMPAAGGREMVYEPWADVDRAVRGDHVRQLVEAGFLPKLEKGTNLDTGWLPTRLTWKGHEFLDTIRHETVWEQLKAKAASEGASLPLTVIQELGTQFLKKKLGLD